MRQIKQNNGFTLIELIVVIAIIAILFAMGFMNYAYSQNLAKMRMNAKDVAQVLYNARNMAINGYSMKDDSSGGGSTTIEDHNKAIGVYFEKGDGVSTGGIIEIYSCNISYSGGYMKELKDDSSFKKFELVKGSVTDTTYKCNYVKNLELYKNIFLNTIDFKKNDTSSYEGIDKVFILFSPIMGEISYFHGGLNKSNLKDLDADALKNGIVKLNISYGKPVAGNTVQQKDLIYRFGTYIVDY